MKNSLINYFKNYYLALNQHADRVRAARKYQSIRKENGLHLNHKGKPKTSSCIMTTLYSSTYKYRFWKNKRNMGFSCGTNPGKAARYLKAVQVISDKFWCRIWGNWLENQNKDRL